MRRSVLLILAVAMILAIPAAASVGRFSPTGKIVQNGTSVKVSGPYSLDSDEAGFVIHASLVQNGSQASGDSSYLTGTSWSATVSSTGSFVAGSANAKATATVYKSDGTTESYTWTQQITLK